eukprot:754634-Hanusia_phi.AAC.2
MALFRACRRAKTNLQQDETPRLQSSRRHFSESFRRNSSFFEDGRPLKEVRVEGWLKLECHEWTKCAYQYSFRLVQLHGEGLIVSARLNEALPLMIHYGDIIGVAASLLSEQAKEDVKHKFNAYLRHTSVNESELVEDLASLSESEHANLFPERPVSRRALSALDTISTNAEEFVIITSAFGHFRGQPLKFRCQTSEERDFWIECIRRALKYEAASQLCDVSRLGFLRWKVRYFYMKPQFQLVVAVFICLNFGINIISAQLPATFLNLLDFCDMTFTLIFAFELSINLFANLVQDFFSDPWNHFDFIVVLFGILSISAGNFPGSSSLKLMRTFRVFRLFKRVPSLKRIVESIFAAIPAMANAYLLLFLISSIYAMMCVNFFAYYTFEDFGTYFRSMFTLWQFMTGDGWSDIVRQLFVQTGNPAGVGIFFVSYQLIVTFTLVNIVICVLVDKFCSSPSNNAAVDLRPYEDANILYVQRSVFGMKSLVEELLLSIDLEDLDIQIDKLWENVCLSKGDGEGGSYNQEPVSFKQLQRAMREMRLMPPVIFELKDWYSFVEYAGLANKSGLLSKDGFSCMLRLMIYRYTKLQLHFVSKVGIQQWDDENINCVLKALKGLAISSAEKADRYQTELVSGKCPEEIIGSMANLDHSSTVLDLERISSDLRCFHEKFSFIERNVQRRTKLIRKEMLSHSYSKEHRNSLSNRDMSWKTFAKSFSLSKKESSKEKKMLEDGNGRAGGPGWRDRARGPTRLVLYAVLQLACPVTET